MKALKVIKVNDESIEFDNGTILGSYHQEDCCEVHYLDFDDLTIGDFDGLEFDLTLDKFFRKVEGYGIELIPVNGYSVKVPGYGSNNGYYSTDLSLVLSGGGIESSFDISECQVITD